MDGRHVRLAMTDEEFCLRLLERFDRHLAAAGRDSDSIVVGLHHVPFRELVPEQQDPSWAFAQAYLGSEQFGEVLLAHPKVHYAFCGHSHYPTSVRRKHVECINVGSTYLHKRYHIVDVDSSQ